MAVINNNNNNEKTRSISMIYRLLYSSLKSSFIFVMLILSLSATLLSLDEQVIASINNTFDSNHSSQPLDKDGSNTRIDLPSEILLEINKTFATPIPLRVIQINESMIENKPVESKPFEFSEWYPSISFHILNETLPGNNKIIWILMGKITSFESIEEMLNDAVFYKNVPLDKKVLLPLAVGGASFMLVKVQFTDKHSGIYYEVFDGNQEGDKPLLDDYLESVSVNEKMYEIIANSSSVHEVFSDPVFNRSASSIICKEYLKHGNPICQ